MEAVGWFDIFETVVEKWVDNHFWPLNKILSADGDEPPKKDRAVVVFEQSDANYDSMFTFRTAISYFEVHGCYSSFNNSLTNLRVKLVVPGYGDTFTLLTTKTYLLPANKEGDELDIEHVAGNLVTGKLCFKYDKSQPKNICMRYNVNVPFAGRLEDDIIISPTNLASSFTQERLNAIPVFSSSELQLYKEQIASATVNTAPIGATETETKLLANFLDAFVKEEDESKTIAIATHYRPDASNLAAGSSDVYEVSLNFLHIFELVGTIDPSKLQLVAGLFARLPIAGRVRIANFGGDLTDPKGVKTDINAKVMKGTAMFYAEKKDGDKTHGLYADLDVKPMFTKDIQSGKTRILTLPF